MDADYNTQYQKLATTPLAKDTNFCFCSVKWFGLLLALLSLLTGPIPCIITGYYMVTDYEFDYSKAWAYNGRDIDYEYLKHRNHVDQRRPRTAFGIIGIISGVFQLLGIFLLLIAVCQSIPAFIYVWNITEGCFIFCGRVLFGFFMYSLGIPWEKYIILLFFADIFLSILIKILFGQIAAVARNKRYMAMQPTIYAAGPKGHLVSAPPPGSYPKQSC